MLFVHALGMAQQEPICQVQVVCKRQPAPLPETRQQMEVQQGNRNCNHSLKREKPARCAGIPRTLKRMLFGR